MRLFGRNSKALANSPEPTEELQEDDPGAPPSIDVWNVDQGMKVYYCVREPWSWVMDYLAHGSMQKLDKPEDLPSNVAAAQALANEGDPSTVTPGRRRRRQQKQKVSATLKIEICDSSGGILLAAHGNSAALDGLEDKDELVRTMQRCRCEDKQISPPSILINWDVTHEECLNVLGDKMPVVAENRSEDIYVVLKEPMGSQGKGVFFVKNAEEIHEIIGKHRQRAQEEENFLDNLIEQKGRIPSWVVQAEVAPCLLVNGDRKFHIRTYILLVEHLEWEDLLETFVYSRHEVRMASLPVTDAKSARERAAHITNGALDGGSATLLLDDVEELLNRGLKDKIELFVATTFGKDLEKDIAGRIRVSANDTDNVRKFAVAGLDLMVTEDERIYLLEVNVDPTVPEESTLSDKLKDHLKGFMRDLALVVTDNESPNFLLASDIMESHGIE